MIQDPRTGRELRRVERRLVETNPELLAEISRKTGGASFRARDSKDLAEVFAEIDALEKTEVSSTRLVRFRERHETDALASLVHRDSARKRGGESDRHDPPYDISRGKASTILKTCPTLT